jgi:hypothetical protein
MGTIKTLYGSMRRFNLDRTASAAFGTVLEDFTDENKAQLFAGFNRFGDHLDEYKSFRYAEDKHFLNPVPGFGNPDLFVTGDFYAGIKGRISGSQILEKSSDIKNDRLVADYPGIFGLGGRFKVEFVKDKYAPAFYIEAKKRIFG